MGPRDWSRGQSSSMSSFPTIPFSFLLVFGLSPAKFIRKTKQDIVHLFYPLRYSLDFNKSSTEAVIRVYPFLILTSKKLSLTRSGDHIFGVSADLSIGCA